MGSSGSAGTGARALLGTRGVRLFSLLSVICTLSGCSLFSSSEPEEAEPKEIKKAEAAVVNDAPEGAQFLTAKEQYGAGLYMISRDAFKGLKVAFPYGPYGEFAGLKSADADFELREYASAAQQYDQLLKENPGSPAAPYMLMQIGRSYELSAGGVGRDETPLKNARVAYERLLRDHADSPYAAAARKALRRIYKDLADAERGVAEFYRKQEKYSAAQARERKLEEEWAPLLTALQEEPKPAVVEVARGVAPKPQPLPEVEEIASAAVAETAGGVSPRQEGVSGIQLVRVQCVDGDAAQQVVLALGGLSTEDKEQLDALGGLEPAEGVVRFSIPGLRTAGRQLDCFGTGDLEITFDGEVLFRSRHTWQVITLENPTRLVLARVPGA